MNADQQAIITQAIEQARAQRSAEAIESIIDAINAILPECDEDDACILESMSDDLHIILMDARAGIPFEPTDILSLDEARKNCEL